MLRKCYVANVFYLKHSNLGARPITHTSTMSSCRVDHYVIIMMTLAAMMRNAPCVIIDQLKVFVATWQKWVLELNVAMSESGKVGSPRENVVSHICYS